MPVSGKICTPARFLRHIHNLIHLPVKVLGVQLLLRRPLGAVSLKRQHLDNPHPRILLFKFKKQVRHHRIKAQSTTHTKVDNATLDERDESMPDPNQYLRLLSGRDNPVPGEAASLVCVLSHSPTRFQPYRVISFFSLIILPCLNC